MVMEERVTLGHMVHLDCQELLVARDIKDRRVRIKLYCRISQVIIYEILGEPGLPGEAGRQGLPGFPGQKVHNMISNNIFN